MKRYKLTARARHEVRSIIDRYLNELQLDRHLNAGHSEDVKRFRHYTDAVLDVRNLIVGDEGGGE